MGGIHVAHLISFLCCVVFFGFILFFVICLVYLKVPVSLDCLFLIAPSVSLPFYKTKNVSIVPLSTMCRLDFGALPTVWYFLVLSFSYIEVLLSCLLGKRLSDYISVKPLRYDWWWKEVEISRLLLVIWSWSTPSWYMKINYSG